MENNCGIMGLREDEIELDLGLSIGGSFGKAEKLKPIKNEPKPSNNSVADLGESVVFDPQTKREVQALRRQEARKKREHKQQKRGISHRNGEFQSKDNGDGAMEERECKKTRVEEFSGNVYPNLSVELNNPLVCPVIPVRVPAPAPYPQLQFLPLANGTGYPCVNAVPYWGGVAGNEKRVVQPVALAVNGGFPSFQTAQDSGVNGGNGYYSEQNSGRDERKRKTGSNGSTMYSSSTGSDLQSSSNQGGCSSETGTPTPQINCSPANNLKGQSEQTADSAQSIDKSRKGIEKTPSLNTTVSTSSNMKKEPKPQTKSDVNRKPVSTNETATTAFSKDNKGKPPNPRTPAPANENVLSLRNMPCVSTTGNGPNGRTINGFLYRYTNSEVSIICVCHGSSFTPAEFVQHAGSADVSHPLRHITMVPTAF